LGHNLSEINHALPTVSRFEAFLEFLKGFEISGIGGWNRIVGQTKKFLPPFVRRFQNASDARLSKSGHRALYRFGASLSFAGYTARKNDTRKYPVTTKCEVSGDRIVGATVKAIVDNRWHPFQFHWE